MRLLVEISRPKLRQGVTLMARSPIQMRRSWQRFIDGMYWDTTLEGA